MKLLVGMRLSRQPISVQDLHRVLACPGARSMYLTHLALYECGRLAYSADTSWRLQFNLCVILTVTKERVRFPLGNGP
jgi:hypothetical protein